MTSAPFGRPGPGDPDAVVVGSGPNGLVAAITLARAGWRVLVLEAAPTPGGGMRSQHLLQPDVLHDVCSAAHPLGLASPALRELPLGEHGLRWIHPDVPLAHPLEDGAVLLERSVAATAAGLGPDEAAYRRLYDPLVADGSTLVDALLAQRSIPRHGHVALVRYGLRGLTSVRWLADHGFEGPQARALLAGLAAHSILSLRAPVTAGYGILFGLLGHLVGWPLAEGGSQAIADALVSILLSLGGTIECDRRIDSLDDLPATRAVILDLGPHQAVALAGDRMPGGAAASLRRFRYGPGVHKVDWVLDGPVPWTDPRTALGGTVHVGGTFAEIAAAEEDVQRGRHPERPFVLFMQPTAFDPTRAPAGTEVGWGYCHVPNGSTVDVTDRMEAQIERFAPGFRDRIVERHVMHTAAMEAYDANYVGGDINGGAADLWQFLARPRLALQPWATPVDGLYLCSASTPPGGGVHGMGGRQAAELALRRAGVRAPASPRT